MSLGKAKKLFHDVQKKETPKLGKERAGGAAMSAVQKATGAKKEDLALMGIPARFLLNESYAKPIMEMDDFSKGLCSMMLYELYQNPEWELPTEEDISSLCESATSSEFVEMAKKLFPNVPERYQQYLASILAAGSKRG